MARTLGLLVAAFAVAGAAAAEPRAVPIHQRTLSDGVTRYSVPVTIDGRMVEAALDTGSTGLRVLAPDAKSGKRTRYIYSGGVALDGRRAPETVTIGELSGEAEVHRVTKVGCTAARRDCSARSEDLQAFGFEGDGLPGEGFRAILGLSLAAGGDNLLRRLGAHRWIVSVPKDGADGRLVIDPDEDDLTGFVLLPLNSDLGWRRDGAHDGVEGCLAPGGQERAVCGPVLLDTGAADAAVVNAGGGEGVWSAGGTLTFAGLPPMRLGKVSAGRGEDMPRPIMLAGAAPYLAFDVLYDPEHKRIGLRPRR